MLHLRMCSVVSHLWEVYQILKLFDKRSLCNLNSYCDYLFAFTHLHEEGQENYPRIKNNKQKWFLEKKKKKSPWGKLKTNHGNLSIYYCLHVQILSLNCILAFGIGLRIEFYWVGLLQYHIWELLCDICLLVCFILFFLVPCLKNIFLAY